MFPSIGTPILSSVLFYTQAHLEEATAMATEDTVPPTAEDQELIEFVELLIREFDESSFEG